MAIAFDAVAAVVESFFSASASTTLTAGSISNGIALIVIACDGSGTLATPTVNASTTGVTRIATKQAAGAGTMQLDWYRLLAPSAGANTLAVTCAGASFVSIWGISYSGVDQTTPFGTPVTGGADSAGPATVNVSTTSGDVVVDALCFDPGAGARTVTVGAGQTERANNSGTGSGLAASEETAAGASTTMSWTLSTSTQWAMAAAIMIAATGGAGPSTAEKMAAIASHVASGGMYGRRWR